MPDFIVDAKGIREVRYRELTREEAAELESAGQSTETYFRLTVNPETLEQITEEEHLDETQQNLGSLHFRAYRGQKRSGYGPEDIAGFVVLSYDELAEERERFKERFDIEVNFIGTQYFFKPERRKNNGEQK